MMRYIAALYADTAVQYGAAKHREYHVIFIHSSLEFRSHRIQRHAAYCVVVTAARRIRGRRHLEFSNL